MDNFESKGAKRSVNFRATNLGKGFFKNILLNVNRRPPKIRSLHTYGVVWIRFIDVLLSTVGVVDFQKHTCLKKGNYNLISNPLIKQEKTHCTAQWSGGLTKPILS